MSEEIFVLLSENQAVAQGVGIYVPNTRRLFVNTILNFMWLGAALFFLFLALTDGWEWYRLNQAGVTTFARIQARTTESCGEDETCHYVTYQFECPLANGERRSYTKKVRVDEYSYGMFGDWKEVPVVYDPENPTLSDIYPLSTREEIRRQLGAPSVIFFVGVLVALFFLRKTLRLLLRERRFGGNARLVHGTLCKARQMRRFFKGEDDYDDYKVTAHYSFVSPTGRVIKDKETVVVRYKPTYLPPPQTPVAIWYQDDCTYKML